MNDSARLERDLTAWLRETAMPQTPDYADDILEETARIRQRPRWAFARRWFPIPELRWRVSVGGMSPVAAVLLLVLALLLAALATFVASSRRAAIPLPFGLAGAGLLAASQSGDIVLSDPTTGVTRTIVSGSDIDEHPRWSLDGTRLAFLRQTHAGQAIVIADASGRILAITDSTFGLDTDTLGWSPDGTQIAFAGQSGLGSGIHIIDVATGAMRPLNLMYNDGEFFWRPPDGRQLLFASRRSGSGLAIASVTDRALTTLPTGDRNPQAIRVLGWTPDGRRAVYQVDDGDEPFRTVVVDVETGAEIHLNVGFGHVSNDGTRVAGIASPTDLGGPVCVVPITGGNCDAVSGFIEVQGPHGAAIAWSPDDRWVAILGEQIWLVDPDGVQPPRPFTADGPGSWQRIAP